VRRVGIEERNSVSKGSAVSDDEEEEVVDCDWCRSKANG